MQATLTAQATAVRATCDGRPDAHGGAAPLRVLTFLNSLAPGGVERVALRLHVAWTAAGVESRLVIADETVVPCPTLHNVTILGRHEGGLARFVALLAALPRAIAQHRPDVLFCAGNTYSAVAVCLKLLLGRRCPPIIAKISNDLVRTDMSPVLRWWYRRWLKLQGRHIDRFVGMAPAMRGEIASLIGVPASRISIIEDPALCAEDLARLAATRDRAIRRHAGRHFLAIGRLVPQKNFAVLLDAFARMAGPADRLTVLGEGAERPALEAKAARLGIADRVVLPGHVEPLDGWLAEADAFVLSSDYEGVPAVVIEALAAGIPIVATDCCISMADLLGQGTLGQIVPVGDSAAFADAMANISNSPAIVAAQRAEAARFTIEHATDRYIAVMTAACAPSADAAVNIDRSVREPMPAA